MFHIFLNLIEFLKSYKHVVYKRLLSSVWTSWARNTRWKDDSKGLKNIQFNNRERCPTTKRLFAAFSRPLSIVGRAKWREFKREARDGKWDDAWFAKEWKRMASRVESNIKVSLGEPRHIIIRILCSKYRSLMHLFSNFSCRFFPLFTVLP